MSLVYITGISAAGKSTVCEELRGRGYEAHDADEDGFTSWRHKVTNEPTHRPDDIAERTNDWYAHHDWKIDRERVAALADNAKDKLAFLCGTTANDAEVWDLFGQVICLTLDEETLKQRLTTRTNNDFGKSPDELSNVLGWHKSSEKAYKQLGAIMIDAARPIDVVVDAILSEVKEQK